MTSSVAIVGAGATRRSHPRAGSAAELGPHDYVFLTVKAQNLSDLAPSLSPLIGPSTTVISGTNGIPWWFFHDFGGSLANHSLNSVDPNRVRDVVAGLRSGGINAEISERIRHEVWSKLWGNMNMNPFERPDALRNSQDAQLCRRA
jgi:ketopantoate reductase